MRVMPPPPQPDSEPDTDVRTAWQKNAKSYGIIIGSALSTILVGTGGLTGLAHWAGIATTGEIAQANKAIATGVESVQKTDENVAKLKTSVEATAKSVDALTKDIKALRADLARKYKRKPDVQRGGQGEQ